MVLLGWMNWMSLRWWWSWCLLLTSSMVKNAEQLIESWNAYGNVCRRREGAGGTEGAQKLFLLKKEMIDCGSVWSSGCEDLRKRKEN